MYKAKQQYIFIDLGLVYFKRKNTKFLNLRVI